MNMENVHMYLKLRKISQHLILYSLPFPTEDRFLEVYTIGKDVYMVVLSMDTRPRMLPRQYICKQCIHLSRN